MSNDIISSDLQATFISDPLVVLYELDLNSTFDKSSGDYSDNNVLRFHPGLDSDLGVVKFHRLGYPAENTEVSAKEYTALPLILDGIDFQSDGALARPTITVANVTNVFQNALDDKNFSFEELVGKRITRRRTFANYIVGGADAANPYELPEATYIIERIAARNNTSVTFELTSPFDVNNVQLPGRVVIGKYCPWIYQGEALGLGGGCSWLQTNQIAYKDKSHSVYVNLDDKRMYSDTVMDAADSNYSSSTTYTKNDIVKYNNNYYQSLESDNLNNTPTDNLNVWWEEVIRFETYNASTAYSVGDHVITDNMIWRCILASTGNTPGFNSVYWTRADLCSKTLTGCKKRYQALPTEDANNKPMQVGLDTSKVLPFGGFPGSVKFS